MDGFVPGLVGLQGAYDFTMLFKISIAQVHIRGGVVISDIQVVGTQLRRKKLIKKWALKQSIKMVTMMGRP